MRTLVDVKPQGRRQHEDAKIAVLSPRVRGSQACNRLDMFIDKCYLVSSFISSLQPTTCCFYLPTWGGVFLLQCIHSNSGGIK